MHPLLKTTFACVTATLIAAFALPDRADALAYPCGAGPGPGEVQVGVMGGSHGIAATPLCEASYSGQSEGPSGAPMGPVLSDPVDNYIAVVTHPKMDDVWATAGQYRIEGAELAVLDPCNKSMGGGCVVLFSGRNVWVAVARDKQGKFYAASDEDPKKARKNVAAVCKNVGANCKVTKLFDARVRYSDIVSEQFLAADFDKEGVFKEYHFPAKASIQPPPKGTPDAGWRAGANVFSKLPDIPGIRKVHFSAAGSWLLRSGDRKGLGCSLTYLNGDQRVLFIGPTVNDKRGALIISSNAVPVTAAARETKATMSGDRGSVDVRVFHLPGATAGDASVILMPTDLPSTIASISDSSPLSIVLEGKKIVDMQIEGGTKAKTAMQQCLAGR